MNAASRLVEIVRAAPAGIPDGHPVAMPPAER
jgi:hypothetical protein